MPIYEYRCTQCDDQFERLQKITEGPLRKCRKCTGRLEKLISRTSFQLKGGGWYDSGYTKSDGGSSKSKATGDDKSSSDSPKKSSSNSKDSSGSSSGSSSGKSESKSA